MKPHSTHCQQQCNQSWYLEVWKETTGPRERCLLKFRFSTDTKHLRVMWSTLPGFGSSVLRPQTVKFPMQCTIYHNIYIYIIYIWLVVWTHLKNISQIGSFPQVGVKIKNIWNHHPDIYQYVAISQALKVQLASAVESPSDRVVYKPGVLSPSILKSGSSKRMCQQKDLSFT